MMAGDAAFCAVMRDTKNVFVLSLEYMIEAFAIPQHNLRMSPELEGIRSRLLDHLPHSQLAPDTLPLPPYPILPCCLLRPVSHFHAQTLAQLP